jgi:hypothetical protein
VKRSLAVLAALTVCVAQQARAQATPFGLREGLSLTDLAAIAGPLSAQEGQPGGYFVTRVPKPHPELDIYGVAVGDSTGLCQVIAGRFVTGGDSASAQIVKRVYALLFDQLTAKYGVASSIEYAAARWLRISDAPLPANLEAITLSKQLPSVPSAVGGTIISLRYRFTNAIRCEAPAPPPPSDQGKDAL